MRLPSPGPLPSLGPRGEGWFVLQVLFIAAIGLAPRDSWPSSLAAFAGPAGIVLGVAGIFIGWRGIFDLGGSLTPFPRPRADGELVERGAYGVIRNPIYAGLILGAFGWSLLRTSLFGFLLSIVFALFLDLKVRREEMFLVAAFDGYEAYRRRTRRFVPGLY